MKHGGVDCGIKQHVSGSVRLTSDYLSTFNGRRLQQVPTTTTPGRVNRVTSSYVTASELSDRLAVKAS